MSALGTGGRDASEIVPDAKIHQLINEVKRLPGGLKWKEKTLPGSFQKTLEVTGDDANDFVLTQRVNSRNPLDFSCILIWKVPRSSRRFILRRYNGNSHPHTNKIEGERLIRVFHMHQATERYQKKGFHEEDYAVKREDYANVSDALRLLLKECSFLVGGLAGRAVEEYGEYGEEH